ncbi:MAG: GNAT family N-acetyltransferase [Alphaproteobacteria bacterium]
MAMDEAPAEISIRQGRDADSPGLIALVGGCFEEYEGCVPDLEGIDADLVDPATAFKRQGGRLWVAVAGRKIVGSIGYALDQGRETVELKKLYVNRAFRRRGLASRLYDLVRGAAVDHGAAAIDLWSDTRFHQAHAFYLSKGFEQLAESRFLNDPSKTTEYHFALHL